MELQAVCQSANSPVKLAPPQLHAGAVALKTSLWSSARQSDNLKDMRAKTATSVRESVGRVGQRRQVVIPKRLVDPDDVLTREESALISKARREMREGKYVTLAKLEHDLAHKRPSRRRKTA
jgi:hypothetical protein